MSGKVVIVTGSTTGIGFETALALLKAGGTVIMVGRNGNKLEDASASLKLLSSNHSIYGYAVDLSSQKQIREGCRKILSDFPQVDVLINNAGTWYSKLTFTEENIEVQFATNHLAPFLLTHLLIPVFKKSEDARVININSDAHFHGQMHFDDLNLTKNYHGLRAHTQSKVANLLFTYEYDRRKPKGAPVMNAVQPGLVKTNIGLKHTSPLHAFVWKLRRFGGVSPGEGAATPLFLASSNECKGISGKYWDRCKTKNSSTASYNINDAKLLWEISEKLCGIRDYFNPEI